MKISDLAPPDGARSERTRVGRGPGSGTGKTAGRGQKGQTSRSGGRRRPGFEGGQTPLLRRIPKRGFFSPGRERPVTAVLNVADLARFPSGAEVTPQALANAGMLRGRYDRVKILGTGALPHALSVSVHAFSQSAREKIVAAGGTARVLPAR